MKIYTYPIIAVLLVAALLAIVYGSYLPLQKAQLYVQAASSASSVTSLQQFEDLFDKAFNYYSPVGGEELSKFTASSILGIVQDPKQSEAVSRALVNYIEPHLFQNNTRHLLTGAYLYQTLWQNFHHPEDYAKAESYFLKAYAIGPKLPPVLYGLLSLYDTAGQRDKALAVAQIILQYWPSDKAVQGFVAAVISSSTQAH